MKNLLKGTWDLHIHVAPDVIKRKCTEKTVAQRMLERGMSGGAIKCHFFETIARAQLINAEYPELNIAGGIVLNRSVGGLNPEAVRKAAMMNGKMLWFPTMDSASFQEYKHKDDSSFDPSELLRACDEKGMLKPEVFEILRIAADHNMVTGTGHLNPDEGMKLLEAAFKCGVKKFVLTHAEHPAINYTNEQQKTAADMGAYIEHSFNNVYFKRCSLEDFIEQIKAAGAEHVILTGDFGQHDAPYFDDAMQSYLEILSEYFTEDEINLMVRKNPEYLING